MASRARPSSRAAIGGQTRSAVSARRVSGLATIRRTSSGSAVGEGQPPHRYVKEPVVDMIDVAPQEPVAKVGDGAAIVDPKPAGLVEKDTSSVGITTTAQGDPPKGHDEWVRNLAKWAYQLTILKVVTYVGDVDLTTNGGVPGQIQLKPQGYAFVTVCDLIGGDSTNVIPPGYKDDEGLRTFHTQQVTSAAAVLPNNLRVLGELVEKILGK